METGDWQKILVWASFVFFLGALLLRQESAINQDLGRHLRLGQAIVENEPPGARHRALGTNFLTYTYPDYPFVNHHWGSEVIFYFIHKFDGFRGIILFKAIILGLTFIVTVFHAASKGPTLGNPRSDLKRLTIAIALTFFSIQMMADRLTTRPEIFGYLLFSILFWILNKKDLSNWRNLPNWMLIPILMIIWVNLHISFVFGLILIYLWSFSALVKKGLAPLSGARPYQAMTIPTISTIVTILNPSGLRGALMPLSIMKDYGYTIVENMTPFFLRAFKPQPEYWIYAGLTAMTFILALLTGKLGKFAGLAILVFSIFPLMAVRHLPFFGLMAPIVLTPPIIEVLKGPAFRWKAGPYQIVTLVAGGLIFAALTNPAPLAYAKLPPVSLAADPRHDEAIKFVKQNHLQGRMWNNYDIGSFLEWSLPEQPTFVDGRPEAFPVGFFQETYIPMQESREKWNEVVKNYDIRWAFAALTDATPWFQKWRQMIQTHEGWKLVYLDKATAIYVKL